MTQPNYGSYKLRCLLVPAAKILDGNNGLIVQAIIISYFIRINESTENLIVSLVFYLVCTIFIGIAPGFAVSKEDVEDSN